MLGLWLALACLAHGETRLLRFPDVHGDKVVFTYGGDLWTASVQGGVAARLTSHPGLECHAKFSPDGRWIAFTGQYDGDEQVYVIPAEGGVPRQLTFYPACGPLNPWLGVDNEVLGWTEGGRGILYRSLRDDDGALCQGSLYTVPLAGGASTRLPLAAAGAGALAPDGRRLAYEPDRRDGRNWKHYAGGLARGLLLLDLTTGRQRPVAGARGAAGDPMWVGRQLCFTSDRDGTRNLYAVASASGQARQLTASHAGDARWPSTDGASRIVYERDGQLRLFDLAAGTDRGLVITVPSDGLATRPTRVEAEVEGFGLAPHGERAVMVARGEVFTVPIDKGVPRNLTRSSRCHDKLARWSPDGRDIAFVSDRSGEEEVYLVDQEGKGGPRALTTTLGTGLLFLTWAPDGRHLAVGDREGRIYVVRVADARLTQVVQIPDRNGFVDCAWSPDGRHLALAFCLANGIPALHLWSQGDGRCRQVTSGLFPVRRPSWDPHGRFLYYLSRRNYGSTRSNLELDFSGGGNWGIFALALRKGTPHPFPPESDEVGRLPVPPGSDRALVIDWEGLAQRVARVPVTPGGLGHLVALPGSLLYQRDWTEGPDRGKGSRLCRFDLAQRRETTLAEAVDGFETSAGGERVLIRQGGSFFLLEAGNGTWERRPVSVQNLVVDVQPADEWAEVFDEVWRRYRDCFYVRNMHGVDWKAVRERYRPLLRHVADRSDLTQVLLDMVGELNVSHAFLGGGTCFQPDRPKVGLPGAVFEVDPAANRYRIARIYEGQNEETRYRSPLTELGVDARVGDYVLAIDGQELKGTDEPYRLLRNRTSPVTLTLSATPSPADARQVTYNPIESEDDLRYLDFVLRSRARAQSLSGGRVGYLHLPDMDEAGLAEFIKWYYPQLRCQALVVDVRGNQGGNISPMLLERLGRKVQGLSFDRGAVRPDLYPDTAFLGPMVCLVNETTCSDGELFAQRFRQAGLGPLVGLRTWGGAVGYAETGAVKDGGFVWVPSVGHCGPDGNWIIEGEGVRPDVEVENGPRAYLAGRDLQLDRAVAEVLQKIDRKAPVLPGRPPDPVKLR